jgi:thiol-disulfide isomerase/thioredoxin
MLPMKSMSCFLFLLLAIYQPAVRAQQPGFTVKGTINADYEGPVLLIVDRDSLVGNVRKRQFSITGSVDYPKFVTVTIPGSHCGSRFYLENSTIQLTLKAEYRQALKKYCANLTKVSGSVSDSIYKAFQRKLNQVIPEASVKKDGSIYKAYVTEFIKANPGFSFSAELISDHLDWYGLPWAKEMYASLNEDAKKTKQGVLTASLIRQKESDRPGRAFRDFTMVRFDGSPFSSASLKGKYVLYDFWASWCTPCRRENEMLLPSYKKYKGKPFEVVSISLDDSRDKWAAAIEKDGLPWVHVSDLKAWKSPIVMDHSISIIPYNILVDPDGVIIDVNLHGIKLKEKLKEIFDQ